MRSRASFAAIVLLGTLASCEPISSDAPDAHFDAQPFDAAGQQEPDATGGGVEPVRDSGAQRDATRCLDSGSERPRSKDSATSDSGGARADAAQNEASPDATPSDSGGARADAAQNEASPDATPGDSELLSDASLIEAGLRDATLGDAEQPDQDACSEPSDSATDAADAEAPSDSCPGYGEVRLYDTHGVNNEAAWTLVEDSAYQFSDVRNVVIQNDLARVTYEHLNDAMQGSHSLYLRRNETWKRLTGPTYGDYTYWATTVTETADSVEITELDSNLIAAKFHILHVVNDVAHDNFQVSIEKTVAIHRCYPGMFLGFHTNPDNIIGEREIGFGTSTELAVSKSTLALHPIAGGHVDLRIDQGTAPHWVVGLHGEVGVRGDDDTLIRYLFLNRPLETNSYQFSPEKWGIVTVHFIDEQTRVPERFHAFIGGMNYPVESLFELEDAASAPVANANASGGSQATLLVGDALQIAVTAPQSGSYSLWLRYGSVDPRLIQLEVDAGASAIALDAQSGFAAVKLGSPIFLNEGNHTLTLRSLDGTLDADALALVPFGENPMFPEELGASIAPILAGEAL
jgi:hypothetical protein